MSCKTVVVKAVLWSAAGEAMGWGGSQVWHLSVLKKLLWRRPLSFPRSFTFADAINTHLAGYPKTSWEGKLINACAHPVWWWAGENHTNGYQDTLYRFQDRENEFKIKANFTQAGGSGNRAGLQSLCNMLFQQVPAIKAAEQLIICFAKEQGKNSSGESVSSACITTEDGEVVETPRRKEGQCNSSGPWEHRANKLHTGEKEKPS